MCGDVRLIPAHAGKTISSPDSSRGGRAHPRSRGENFTRPRPASVVCGSSPLTRGKHALSIRVRRALGLIPAHAEKTLPVSPRRSRTRAHPRSHGENMGLPIGYVSTPGSSPLTRGKRASGWHGASCGGLIPAHAGKTDQRGARGSTRAAHPRSRGENMVLRDRSRQSVGSSPLTRGKRISSTETAAYARLIPAHTGKTATGATSSRITTAHPRSRGENVLPRLPSADFAGSSPLTRGKPKFLSNGVVQSRLIPAHAGKTLFPPFRSATRAAHPRSRGENRLSIGAGDRRAGSSPLTRGKRRPGGAPLRPCRLIPAHAGKTSFHLRLLRSKRAHPRSRGENQTIPTH